jgi:hypothetical protein
MSLFSNCGLNVDDGSVGRQVERVRGCGGFGGHMRANPLVGLNNFTYFKVDSNQ